MGSMAEITNGVNGVRLNGTHQGETFLFTSESVGQGHPDKIAYVSAGISVTFGEHSI
jgi:hypothetical protein